MSPPIIRAPGHGKALQAALSTGNLEGKIEVTIAGGKIVWENEELKVVPGSGKYIEMPPYNYLFDGIDETAELNCVSSLKAPVKRSIQTS